MSRMKKMERRNFFMRVGAVLIAVCMIAALAIPAFAADATYSYTVRIFPGDKGTVDGGKDPIVKVVEPGYSWNGSDFDYGSRAASDTDKYYVRGLREAGRDNNTTNDLINPAFTVDHDIDLVVAYGVKDSDVEYTINYVELGSDKELMESRTYHGNVGDKPAVAYLYIEGYVPQYENITGTLDADSAKNVWTFYYVDVDDESVAVNSNSVSTMSTKKKSTASKSGGAAASSGSSSNGSGTSTGSSTSTANGSNTSTGTAAGTQASGSSLSVGEGTMLASNGTVNTLKNGPVEIVDVDEVETPLVEYDGTDETAVEENGNELVNREAQGVVRAEGMSGATKMIFGVVIVMAVAAAGWFFFRRLRAGDEE